MGATSIATRAPARDGASVRRHWGAVAVVAASAALVFATHAPGALGTRATVVAATFVAIVAEALPFLLIGAAVAALVQGPLYGWLLHQAAHRPRLAAALAPLGGTMLPVCDCGLVPLARDLHRQRADGALINAFITGAPLTNPIVILSTVVAFPGSPGMVAGRVSVGLAVAMLAGALAPRPATGEHAGDHDHAPGGRRLTGSLAAELARTGPTLVAAALAAAVVKGFLPADTLTDLDAQPLVAAGLMMGAAFLLSICSQADAFFAASLPVGTLPQLAFLVLGPMLNLRQAALYRREFGTRWLRGYALVVVPSVLVLTVAWTTWVGA